MQDLKEATRELDMLTSIMSEQSTSAPGMASTPSGTTSEDMQVDKPGEATASTQDENEEHPEAPPAKWQKGDAKGQNKAGRGKGRKQDSERSDNHNWSNSSWKKWDDKSDKEHKELKSLVVMMGNLLLRHEDQQNITRLDGGFVLFLRTDVDNQRSLSHGPAVENHEATISRKTGASNAGGAFSVRGNVDRGQVGEGYQRPGAPEEGRRGKVDLSGRTDHFVPAVGQLEESPHASSWREPRPHQRGEHPAYGVGHHCQASTGGQQIPCNPPSLGGIQLASSSDVDRGGGAHGRGEQGLADFGQAGLHIGLDLQYDISAARAPTEEPTGQSCFRLSSADVLALRLGNSNNFCYMNSVAICLLWVCTQFPDQVMIPSMVCKLLQGAARSGQVFHVWHSFTWKAILAGWSRPLLQHDAAEFLYFVCPKFPLFDFLNGHWQARELEDFTCRITDMPR